MARSAATTRTNPDAQVVLKLSRRQVIAIKAVFDLGIKACDAFGLIANTGTAEAAMNDLVKQVG